MFLAFGWTDELGHGEVSLGERVQKTLVAGLFHDQRIENRQGGSALIDRTGILPKRFVDRADPQVGSAHLVADLGIAGIARLERLETLEGVIQQVAAYGLCLGDATEPLVGDPHKHLRDRRESVACVLLGVRARRLECKVGRFQPGIEEAQLNVVGNAAGHQGQGRQNGHDDSRRQRLLPPHPEPDSLPGRDRPGDDGLAVEITAQVVGQSAERWDSDGGAPSPGFSGRLSRDREVNWAATAWVRRRHMLSPGASWPWATRRGTAAGRSRPHRGSPRARRCRTRDR